VPADGVSDLAPDHEAEARRTARGGRDRTRRVAEVPPGRDEKDEMTARHAASGAVVLRALELGVLAEAAIGTEGERHAAPSGPSRARLLLVDRRDEALPPLPATIGQHLAAASGGHTGSKPVRAGAADIVRLIGALHGSNSGTRKKAPARPTVKPRIDSGFCWYGAAVQ